MSDYYDQELCWPWMEENDEVLPTREVRSIYTAVKSNITTRFNGWHHPPPPPDPHSECHRNIAELQSKCIELDKANREQVEVINAQGAALQIEAQKSFRCQDAVVGLTNRLDASRQRVEHLQQVLDDIKNPKAWLKRLLDPKKYFVRGKKTRRR